MNGHEQQWRVYRATLDTNIFVRSVIRKKNPANRLLSLWLEEKFVLVLSQPIIDEIQKVLSRPKMRRKHKYTLTEVTNLVNLLNRANIGDIASSFELCRDPEDDMFIDCAVSGRVHFLVSYDNDLIDDSELEKALSEFGIEIAEPLDFLKKIQEAEINDPT